MPSAEVPLMMPATIIVFAFMLSDSPLTEVIDDHGIPP
jgi:hypothetical protein